MRSALAGIFLGIFFAGSVAHADDAAPAKKVPDFVPFVVDAKQDAAIRAYLNEMRFKDAAPVIVWLNDLETRAKDQWAADNAPKVPEEKK